MKTTLSLLLIIFCTFSIQTLHALPITITIKIEFGKKTSNGDCGPGRGICSITLGGGTDKGATPGKFEVVEGTIEHKEGKLYVTTMREISERGKSERGVYSVTFTNNTPLDPLLSKKLGLTTPTSIAAGEYTLTRNTFVFALVSRK